MAVVVALADAVAVVVVDADVDEAGEVLTPFIALHLRTAILTLKLANILKKNSGNFTHTRNIKFIR